MIELADLVMDDRARGVFRVHRSTMTSPEIFALERERIFERCWLYLGHESEVPEPGDFVRRTRMGRPLIFSRDVDGELRAFYNACTHRGATVCREDAGNARNFQCFYHSWTFDTRGRLVAFPDPDGYSACFDRSELGLRAPRVDSYRGFVFVSFAPDAEELRTYLAGATEYLDLVADVAEDRLTVVAGTQLYATKANWKLLVENSLDAYHLHSVHQSYFEFLRSLGPGMAARPQPDGLDHVIGRPNKDLGNGHAVIETSSLGTRPIARWGPEYDDAAKQEIEDVRARLVERHGEARAYRMADMSMNLLVFPNLVVNDGPALTVRYFEPLAPDYMEVAAWALAPQEELDRADEGSGRLARRIESFLTFLGPAGFATPDDVEALEACQEGFRALPDVAWSDISRGMARIPGIDDELQMRSFWRGWVARMTGRPMPERVMDVESPDARADDEPTRVA